MPAPAAKDAKKKKKSKKELEVERLAAEELRRKEEEAARAAELVREQERAVAEQKARESREAFLDGAESEFEAHRDSARHHWNDLLHRVRAELIDADRATEWNAYLECSRLPNPKIEAEVASFLSEFGQIPDRPSFGDMQRDLGDAEQLHLLLSACLSRAIDTQERDPGRFVHDIRSTRRCINRKWDALTAHILQNSETYPRESTENLQIVQEFPPNYRFCVWGNYTRNPRHKTFDISGGLHVTLPKSLTLANVAIRVIHDRSFASLTDFALQHAAGTRTPATQHQRHTVLDGVLHFSLLELPELPKTVDFWTIRQLMASDLSVREVSYPFPRGEEEGGGDGEEGNGGDGEGPPKSADGSGGSGGATSSQGGGGGDSSLNSSMAGKDDDAMLISYTIGAGLFLNPVATVKWWSSETQTWRSEGVSDVEIDRTKGSVMFKSSMFRPCALVQPGYLEFPPENWRIFPLPVSRVDLALGNAVRMVVNGKWTDLEIEITRAGVSLIRPMTDRLRLSMGSLSLAPSRFFDTLARFGIAFSSPHDLSTAPKLSAIDTYDDECYCAMAAKSERLGFSAHKLNSGETIRLINVSLNPTVPDAAAPTPASDVPPGIAPMPKASAVASAAEEDGMMPPSAGGNAFSAEAAPPKSAGSGTLGPGAVDPALDGSDKAASAPKTADAALTVVADYDHVVLAKSRKLFYVAAPGNYGQWPEDQQPQGSMYALLDQLAPGQDANQHLQCTVAQVLRIINLLNVKADHLN